MGNDGSGELCGTGIKKSERTTKELSHPSTNEEDSAQRFHKQLFTEGLAPLGLVLRRALALAALQGVSGRAGIDEAHSAWSAAPRSMSREHRERP